MRFSCNRSNSLSAIVVSYEIQNAGPSPAANGLSKPSLPHTEEAAEGDVVFFVGVDRQLIDAGSF